MLSGIGLAGLLIHLSEDLPDVESLRVPNFELPSVIYDRNGNKVYELYIERRVLLKKEEIPQIVKDALISVEDSRFYKHAGIDPIRIIKSAWVNLRAGKIVEGASTITQQTAKQFFLNTKKEFKRKILEVLLAMKIEKHFEKEEILELYLNKAYFGRRTNGIEAAAQEYFSKSAKDLALEEAALLIGLLKAPSSLSPTKNPLAALDRRNLVLKLMHRNKYITKEEMEISSAKKVVLNLGRSNKYDEVAYYIEEIRRYLVDRFQDEDKDYINQAGLKVHTYMDLNLQIAAQKALRNGLEEIQKRNGFQKIDLGKVKIIDDQIDKEEILRYVAENELENGSEVKGIITSVEDDQAMAIIDMINDKQILGKIDLEHATWAVPTERVGQKVKSMKEIFELGDVAKFKISSTILLNSYYDLEIYAKPESNGGFIAMDPNNGEVLAIVGGYDFSSSQFNRAVQSKRQPGSTFKPILYGAAIEKNFTAASMLNDNPYSFENGETVLEESTWRPQNYSGKFSGYITLRDSLVHSKNVPTVRLLEEVGIRNFFTFADKLGLNTEKFPIDYSIALGTPSVTLTELITAYSVYANGGKKARPFFIKKIVDRDGNIIEDFQEEKESNIEQVITPQEAYIMTTILEDVVKSGTGRKARALGRPNAGKTGTTNNYSDAWYIGYVPDLIAGVFVGNDIPAIPLGEIETGSSAALPIWLDFMKTAVKTMPVKSFNQPSKIINVKINITTGLLLCTDDDSKNIRFESFIAGTEPTTCHQDENALSADDALFTDIDGQGSIDNPNEEL